MLVMLGVLVGLARLVLLGVFDVGLMNALVLFLLARCWGGLWGL